MGRPPVGRLFDHAITFFPKMVDDRSWTLYKQIHRGGDTDSQRRKETRMINLSDYRDEIEGLARDARIEAREYNREIADVIHEMVDGHSWIIYSKHHPFVLGHSENADAGSEYGDLNNVLRTRGAEGLLGFMACAAMIADVEQAALRLEDEDEDEDEDEV